eukprot:GHVU01084304.1.p1 GENE.GHVU01084304.1~~GHVU01084304.1.p1  ORF type:complete len:164 (-),score=18.09 GHVU01084304.1:82-573(-)
MHGCYLPTTRLLPAAVCRDFHSTASHVSPVTGFKFDCPSIVNVNFYCWRRDACMDDITDKCESLCVIITFGLLPPCYVAADLLPAFVTAELLPTCCAAAGCACLASGLLPACYVAVDLLPACVAAVLLPACVAALLLSCCLPAWLLGCCLPPVRLLGLPAVCL